MNNTLTLSPDAQDLLFREARTANTFTDAPVTDEQIAAIYDLVKYAPTATNTQPLRVVAIRSQEARGRLANQMYDGNRDKVLSAPLVLVLAADTNFHEHLPRTFPHFPDAKEWFTDYSDREKAANFSATLQAGYFLLGVRAAGLAAGPMTGFNAAGVDAELFGGTPLKSLMVMCVGHPGENAWRDRLPRLEHHEVVLTY